MNKVSGVIDLNVDTEKSCLRSRCRLATTPLVLGYIPLGVDGSITANPVSLPQLEGSGLMPISTKVPELQEGAPLDLATVTYAGIILALSVLGVLVWRRFEVQAAQPRINRSIEE